MTLREIIKEILGIATEIQNNTLEYRLAPLVKAGKKSDPADLLMQIAAAFKMEVQSNIAPSKQKTKKAIDELKRIRDSYQITELSSPITNLSAFLEK